MTGEDCMPPSSYPQVSDHFPRQRKAWYRFYQLLLWFEALESGGNQLYAQSCLQAYNQILLWTKLNQFTKVSRIDAKQMIVHHHKICHKYWLHGMATYKTERITTNKFASSTIIVSQLQTLWQRNRNWVRRCRHPPKLTASQGQIMYPWTSQHDCRSQKIRNTIDVAIRYQTRTNTTHQSVKKTTRDCVVRRSFHGWGKKHRCIHG